MQTSQDDLLWAINDIFYSDNSDSLVSSVSAHNQQSDDPGVVSREEEQQYHA